MTKKDARGTVDDAALLGAAQVRELAERLEVRPTKQWGQNFVVDANTVRKIVRVAGVGADDVVVEVGPGLGSLTLALLPVVQVGHRRRGRPAARRRPRGDGPPAPARQRRPAASRRGGRPDGHEAARPRPDRAGRQPAVQHLGPGRAVVPPALPDDRAGPRHGAARGRRAARGEAGRQDLRRPEPQGGLVCRRRARRTRRTQRLLARPQRRLGPRLPPPPQAAEDDGDAARTSSAASTRPSSSAARPCVARSRRGRAPPTPPSRRSSRPASTRGRAGSSSTSRRSPGSRRHVPPARKSPHHGLAVGRNGS